MCVVLFTGLNEPPTLTAEAEGKCFLVLFFFFLFLRDTAVNEIAIRVTRVAFVHLGRNHRNPKDKMTFEKSAMFFYSVPPVVHTYCG